MRSRAVFEIKIDQRLIRKFEFFRQIFEVADRVLVETNGELLLETLRVGIGAGIGKVVSLSHGRLPRYCADSCVSALRAEMIRMTSPPAR